MAQWPKSYSPRTMPCICKVAYLEPCRIHVVSQNYDHMIHQYKAPTNPYRSIYPQVIRMPPRAAPGRGGYRGGPRGGRGAGTPRGGGGAQLALGLPSSGSHITTVGVKRPNFGTGGRELPVFVNSFVTTIPEGVIHHYDGKSKLDGPGFAHY